MSVRESAARLPAAIGRYEVRELLGEGAFGAVYRAFDPHLEREVALKVLRPEWMTSSQAVERFLREAKAAAQLLHPHIVPVHDAGRAGDVYYIASAFIRGKTLAAAVPAEGMAPRRAAELAAQLASALGYAHRQGVVHRDVKPQNVLLDEQGSLHLADFGFAGWVEEENTRLTQEGAVIGTPLYMAPEQASGDTASVGPASDLYSAGVVLYELLTGRPPFTAPHASGLAYQIVHTAPPSPSQHRPGLDAGLEAICLKALAKRPEERFGSGEEMAAALTAWAASGAAPAASAGAPPSGEVETQAYRPDRPARRWGRWKWVAAAGLLLPVLALAATESAGFTHLLGTAATTAHPTAPGQPTPQPGPGLDKSEGDGRDQLTKDAVVVMNFEQDSFYQKDGKTYVRDLSGQGNDGLCDGVVYIPDGKAGGGLLCKGGNLRFAKSFINRQRSYTITLWCRSEGPLGSLYLASAPDLTNSVFDTKLSPERTLSVFAWNASLPKNWIEAATDSGAAPTGWFFFAASLADGETGSGKLRIVIDDRILERTSQRVWCPALKIVDSLGHESDEAVFDELAVFNRALSDQEIMAIRAQGLKGIPFGPN